MIRKARQEDLNAITRLYADCMFESFFLKFDSSFVRRYLEVMLRSRSCRTLVAGTEGEGIAGFIVAVLDGGRVFQELLFGRNIARLLLIRCLEQPRAALGVLEACLYPARSRVHHADAELLFIVVAPAFRRQGLARSLLRSMLDVLRERQARVIKVTTAAHNAPANRLLENAGFRRGRTFRMFNKDMVVYSFAIK